MNNLTITEIKSMPYSRQTSQTNRTRRSSIDSPPLSPNSNLHDHAWFAESEFVDGLDLQCTRTNRPTFSTEKRLDGNNSISKSNDQPPNIDWNNYINGVWNFGKSCCCLYCTFKRNSMWGYCGYMGITKLFVGEHDMAGALAYTSSGSRILVRGGGNLQP